MNTNDPKENKLLDAMLQQWQTKSPLPPRFQEHVWQRVERAETAPAPAISLTALFANWIATVLPRPALGWSQARQETARVTGELSARYAQTIDPYQGVPQP